MRLLNVKTLRLESFFDRDIPPYAILSHRWGDDEVTYEDMRNGPTDSVRRKTGFAKVKGACELTPTFRSRLYRRGAPLCPDPRPYIDYVWIDTCCIDKSSSAELSEAINSMFEWYRKSELCFAFLDDVTADGKRLFATSKWATRGWTLQELIAPDYVVFYDMYWNRLGERVSMSEELFNITGVPAGLLSRPIYVKVSLRDLLGRFSIAARMSWASRRVATRVEDQAYCLMGLFDVHMPLIYGEGRKAFRRLQEAIVRETNDMSILVGATRMGYNVPAVSAASFRECANLELGPEEQSTERLGVVFANHELELTTLTCPATMVLFFSNRKVACTLALLNCSFAGDYLSRPVLLCHHLDNNPPGNRVSCNPSLRPFPISPGQTTKLIWKRLEEYSLSEREEEFSLLFDLGDCKVKTLYVSYTGHGLNEEPPLRTFIPPLYVKYAEKTSYRTLRVIEYPTDRTWDEPTSRRCQGVVCVTDAIDDHFFIFWGVVTGPAWTVDTWPGWWKDTLPWCGIVDRVGRFAGVELPPEGREEEWMADIGLSLFEGCLPVQSVVTSRRPRGCEVCVAMTAVDFLGRRAFEMTIEDRAAEVATASGIYSTQGPDLRSDRSSAPKRVKTRVSSREMDETF